MLRCLIGLRCESVGILSYFELSQRNPTDALKRENRVEIRGLFSFYIKNYKGYIGQNPKTGKDVLVKPKKLPVFKCGKDLKELINY
ncbi:MAG: hypothetical protein B6I31_01545 [Desulfobacteraceae bacterium 4572_19]|nr:MAG: hypothetical protein B6I31_01545 [Desulfobacteraceae bacterium 4572_19]